MPRILEAYPPLQQLCRNAKVETDQIVSEIKRITGEDLTTQGVIAMQRRGTRNVDYLQAIANLTGLPMSVISEAGKPAK